MHSENGRISIKEQKWKWQVAAVVGSKPVVDEGHTEDADEAKRLLGTHSKISCTPLAYISRQ